MKFIELKFAFLPKWRINIEVISLLLPLTSIFIIACDPYPDYYSKKN